MATRLYPCTTNPTVLELLAGVPAGTAARHAAVVATFEPDFARIGEAYQLVGDDENERLRLFWEREEVSDRKYNAVHAERDLALYDSFVGSGWGRMAALPSWWTADRKHDPVCGETTDADEILDLLAVNNIPLPEGVAAPDLQGLHWG